MNARVKAAVSAFALIAFASPAPAQLSGDLVIFSDMSNPAPRAVMEDMAERFGEMHPDLNIQLTVIDRDAYKTQIRNFLTANPPDVFNWYAANRMRPYVEAGLFADVSDLWNDPEIAENLSATRDALTVDGVQYGVPYTYYQWGVYYRADIYEELGLEEPTTWEEELANCEAILASGRYCYAIGTRFLWTAAGWFDYLNMRINGFDFHMELTRGDIPWTDQRVRDVFDQWRVLVGMGAYLENHQSYSWQEALPFIVNGDAAAYLMGNFVVAPLRDGGLTDDQLNFYQFVQINPDVELAEDAPMDTFHIASNAQNPEAAREFLRFVVTAENQTIINRGDALGQLPVNAAASIDADQFLEEGFAMLTQNSPGGIAQFFDRDTEAEMASVAMEGFQEFMVIPDNLDAILDRLERTRQRLQR